MKLVTAGKQVIMCNDLVAHSHFVSDTRQLFETEEGSFVYKMDEKVVCKLKDDTSYTRLLLKLLPIQERMEEEAYIKNLDNEYRYNKYGKRI
jgi:hypothetical protein